jgi:hypothetical protein
MEQITERIKNSIRTWGGIHRKTITTIFAHVNEIHTTTVLVYEDGPHIIRFGSSKLLLALASTAILVSRSRGTYDHTSLSHDSGSLATTYSGPHTETREMILVNRNGAHPKQ